MTILQPLFDLETTPKARARRTDPLTSHMAAEVATPTIKPTKLAVLRLIQQEGSLPGSELNILYATRRDRYGWARISYDSPRKRAGELVRDGLLFVIDTQVAEGNHLPESYYALTAEGREAIA